MYAPLKVPVKGGGETRENPTRMSGWDGPSAEIIDAQLFHQVVAVTFQEAKAKWLLLEQKSLLGFPSRH